MMTDLTLIRGGFLSNFFLYSDGFDSIEHVKISLKFDNSNKGKARTSFRIISKSLEIRENLSFFILIKNDENAVRIEKEVNTKYNKHLKDSRFRKVAGAYGLEPDISKDFSHCTVFAVEEFPENPDLVDKKIIHPNKITSNTIEYRNAPDSIKGLINNKDILLKFDVNNAREIFEETSCIHEKPYIFVFQFRIFFKNFIPSETLSYWQKSSKSWAVDFDLNRKRGYENLIENLDRENLLRYPHSIELWFTIPHSHFFVASSPVYEKAFRLKSEDLGYKTAEEQVGEFETREGDYAVKIMNRSGSFVEFSIVCVSPFLPEEEPEKLRKEIENFQSASSKFVTWKGMVNPLVLLLAFLALIFAVISLFIGGMTETLELKANLWTISVAAVFFGLSVWGISASLNLLSYHLSLKRRRSSSELITEYGLEIKFFTISIIVVTSILAFSLFYLLGKTGLI